MIQKTVSGYSKIVTHNHPLRVDVCVFRSCGARGERKTRHKRSISVKIGMKVLGIRVCPPGLDSPVTKRTGFLAIRHSAFLFDVIVTMLN
jgi:hypothetical protein